MNDYTEKMHAVTLRARLVRLLTAQRRSRWTDQGCDPRNTATHWHWRAIGALNYRLPVQQPGYTYNGR